MGIRSSRIRTLSDLRSQVAELCARLDPKEQGDIQDELRSACGHMDTALNYMNDEQNTLGRD